MTAAALWDRLKADALVEGDMPDETGPESPWFVRVMLGIAGWIGALFLIAFVGAGFMYIMEDGTSAMLLGLACCGAAFALFRALKDNDLAVQFGLAISLAGQVMLAIGLSDFFDSEDPVFYLAIAATQAALALAVPNFLHRVLATSGTAIALALAINQMSLNGLAAPLLCAGLVLVWLEPKRWAAGGSIWRPIGYGLLLAPLLVETFRLFGAERLFFSSWSLFCWSEGKAMRPPAGPLCPRWAVLSSSASSPPRRPASPRPCWSCCSASRSPTGS